jgi:hypothetical protein
MTTESSLSNTIDKLAEQKAKSFLEKVRQTVQHALNPLYRPNDADNQWCGEDIATVLHNMASSIRNRDHDTRLIPSTKLVDTFRAAILKELLDNMPRITELAKMQHEMEQ